MAVSGLHNVSNFGPSFFGDSQRRWDEDHVRPNTRASSLLQMWREIEGEHNQSDKSKQRGNGSDSECVSTTTSVGNGSENGDDLSQTSDEFANQGFSGSDMDNNSEISEQSIDLGEMERERVRQIFQEWMNTGPKGRSSCEFRLNNRTEQLLGENERERVRIIREWAEKTMQTRNICRSSLDGVAEVGSQIEEVRDGLVINAPKIGARRPIRRLCGRQTLIDLLQKAQNERRREILSLSEQRPVSNFVHRNRIQALLRGRFLRNDGLVLDRRPSSVAATELGMLRQRQTVSGLREGFLSKLDSSASTSVNSAEPDSFSSDGNYGESESTCTEGEVTETPTASLDWGSGANREWSTQELELQVTEAEDLEVLGEQINSDINDESSSQYVDINDSGSHEVHNEHYVLRSDVSHARDVVDHSTNSEHNTNEEFDSLETSAQVEDFHESVMDIEDSASQQLDIVAFAELDDDRERGSNQSLPEPLENNVHEQDQIQEPHDWPSHNLQEAIDSWLDMPSEEEGTSVERLGTLYFPDDDNVQGMELRELLSRRRVSGLLRSGFRESLDQVLQSHAERLIQASDDWELDDASFPASIEQNQEQINGDQPLAPSDGAERSSFTPSYPLWDEDLHGANWLHYNSNQQLGTEYEVINGLKIDMARLQQRMNDMQNMLEVCMGMQIELQRSIRQEVSAALNRSIFSRDTSEDSLIHDESQWDHVRRGICCLCQDSKIDSLLYRCGHMCACAKCAENLVKSNGKCPMCQAPTVEAVRAYFIQ
ncbi:hypothetical protein ACS0TY_014561 [Phlomoides rotata]